MRFDPSERPGVALLSRQTLSSATKRRGDQGASSVLAVATQYGSVVPTCPVVVGLPWGSVGGGQEWQGEVGGCG